jgi:tRNA U34 5-carboxymethylaminomethyl modifying GTPase MnmE/TrmE
MMQRCIFDKILDEVFRFIHIDPASCYTQPDEVENHIHGQPPVADRTIDQRMHQAGWGAFGSDCSAFGY